jgi:hypothetical protein
MSIRKLQTAAGARFEALLAGRSPAAFAEELVREVNADIPPAEIGRWLQRGVPKAWALAAGHLLRCSTLEITSTLAAPEPSVPLTPQTDATRWLRAGTAGLSKEQLLRLVSAAYANKQRRRGIN